METNQKKSGKSRLAVIIVLAGLLLTGNFFLFSRGNNFKEEKESALAKSDSLTISLNGAKEEYLRLSKEKDEYLLQNKKLNSSINQLQREISSVKENPGNTSGISGLSNKIKGLEKQKNESDAKALNYQKENGKLLSEIAQIKKTNSRLNEEIVSLKKKLEVASELRVTAINIECFKVKKEKSKATEKARKINRINVSFDIFENLVADPGTKTVYVLLFNEKGQLIDTKGGNFYNKRSAKNEAFTARKEIKFANAEMKESVSFDFNEKLSKGKYRVEIYTDGALSGKRELTLK
ncbi:MAG: hypothetical protein ACKOXB_10875 [Flavobacteriales bacterium]